MEFALDTNLAVLLIVGIADRTAIGRHRRLQDYGPDDFDVLLAVLQSADRIVVPPHVLAETSNLIGRGLDAFHRAVIETFVALLAGFHEEHVSALVATRHPDFARLGLTDSVLLVLASRGATILTADQPLYLAALAQGCEAVNFADLRAYSASRA